MEWSFSYKKYFSLKSWVQFQIILALFYFTSSNNFNRTQELVFHINYLFWLLPCHFHTGNRFGGQFPLESVIKMAGLDYPSPTIRYKIFETNSSFRRKERQEHDFFSFNMYLYKIYIYIKCFVTFLYETGLNLRLTISEKLFKFIQIQVCENKIN